MTYQGSRVQLKEVEQLVEDQTLYQFLNDHFEGPKTDKTQMLWLHEAMCDRDSGLSETERYRVVSATLYVILAHDTHDVIDEINDTHKLTREQRELTVLAGDFYSALYYKTMAELKMTDLLAVLQQGVQKTNTAKANVYQLNVATDAELMEQLVATKAAIFAEFARYFNKDEAFIDFASKTILLKRLLQDKAFYVETKTSLLLKAYEHGYFAKAGVAQFEDWLTQIIADVKVELNKLLSAYEGFSPALLTHLNELLNAE
ncbi:heptaprenyl diphosphate synthase component 1 [Listeria sp. PSOL-1]|uniref:heptaprenyl diphosphate synthase component 1 n=1 Tax=Listeria sp. PSOL-1 TaxID=1844999 RepID=UPI0013D67C82|nr:heptaprenyl diphosphate synthase component 1 [Listeria sp. PSOL-1]